MLPASQSLIPILNAKRGLPSKPGRLVGDGAFELLGKPQKTAPHEFLPTKTKHILAYLHFLHTFFVHVG
jgi:hypothetical protein